MSNLDKINKPDLDEMMKNDKTDNFNTMHLKDFANARLEIQKADIPQNGVMNSHGKQYNYTKLEDMINIAEPILLKHNLLSNFTEIETEEGNNVKIKYRMRITHVINRQYFESIITVYSGRRSQEIGTQMTYARRYLYESILLIRGTPDTDADDGKRGDLS
tara:strand:- start:12139 stop:12621 length:483 start_codon:yes stop_codon:yes gene_type:complete